MVINQPSRHTLSADEVARQLQTSIQTGLDTVEAAQRLARFGANGWRSLLNRRNAA